MSKQCAAREASQTVKAGKGHCNNLVQLSLYADNVAPNRLDHLAVSDCGESETDEQHHQFSFVCDHFDAQDSPSYQLYRCCRDVTSMDLSSQSNHQAQMQLSDQIRLQLACEHGVQVASDEILLTQGREEALQLLAHTLFSPQTEVAIENPGRPSYQTHFQPACGSLKLVDVDDDGITIGAALTGSDFVCVTPSSQYPTSVTMPVSRREALLQQACEQDFYIVEDTFEQDTQFIDQPLPSLKQLDRNERVISMGCLSASTALDINIGYIIAPAALIKQMHSHRTFHLDTEQLAVATQFLAMGYYQNHMLRVRHTLEQKWLAMITALECYMPQLDYIATPGSAYIWLKLPYGLERSTLIAKAANEGIILQADNPLSGAKSSDSYIVLGISAINKQSIDGGVGKLGQLIQSLCAPM